MNATLVGAFVLIMAIVLISIILWLASGGLFRKKVDMYLAIEMESVAGLDLNAPVKYNGVNVGKVTKIALDPNNPEQVNLTFAIEHLTPIREDTVAVLKSQGLTGITYVDLSGSTLSSPALRVIPGNEYPIIHTRPSLSARMENVLTTVLASLDTTSKHINTMLSAQNLDSLKNTLSDIASVTHAISLKKEALARSIGNADITLANTAHLSARAKPALDKIALSADSVNVMGQSVTRTSDQVGKTVGTMGAGFDRFAGASLPELERLISELDALSGSMRRLAEQTERSPNSLVFGMPPVPKGPGEISTEVPTP